MYVDLGKAEGILPRDEQIRNENYDVNGKFIFTLGGEHSVSIAPFHVISEKRPEEITVLQIDAHADLRNDDSDYSDNPFGKNAHCCVIRRAHELGLRTVQVGIRAYSEDEYRFMKDNSMIVFDWNKEKLPSVEEIVESVKTDKAYLTIDVDGIDPSYMPATGTPVQGGLEWRYTMRLIRHLSEQKHIIAADIVEVAPRASDALTEYGAAQICYNLIACRMARK